jgi:hypothetical protein
MIKYRHEKSLARSEDFIFLINSLRRPRPKLGCTAKERERE